MKIGGGGGENIGERCPPGVHAAVLVGVYDVGAQEGFQGKIQRKVVFAWEVSARDTKGRNFVLFERLTNSSHEKSTMVKRFGSLVGRAPTAEESKDGFDDALMVGKSCLVNVVASDKEDGWPYIDNVMPMPTGMEPHRQKGVYNEEPRYVVKMRESALTPDQVASRKRTEAVLGKPTSADVKAAEEVFGGRSVNVDDPPF